MGSANNQHIFVMIAEFSIIPLGGDVHISTEIAEALKIVDGSGLPYQLTPFGTCLEGEWNQVLPIVQQCHDRVRQISPHVITSIRIEDEQGAKDKLRRNIESVEEKVGHPLHRENRARVIA
jgi:uncharacterized protein (TIGR00106 family)